MTLFKAGDQVRRIHSSCVGVMLGNVYEVEYSQIDWRDDLVLVGVVGQFDFNRFELVSSLLASPKLGTAESDPSGLSLNAPGAKADAGKLRPTLVLRDMSRALLAVTKIATDGAAKYSDGGWILVPNGPERYEDASLRHMLKRFAGQEVDTDSGEAHLAHEAWNSLAKLDLYLREKESKS